MVSVIIVDYKSMDQTMSYINNFIEKISALEDTNFIIVDNSQDDHNFYKLNEKYKYSKSLDINKICNDDLNAFVEKVLLYNYEEYTIISIKANENLGFAKGNNLGALISKNIFNSVYIIFSNNDLIIEKPFSLKTLLKPFNLDSNIAVIGPRIVGLDNRPQSPRKKVSIWKLLILYNLNMLTVNLFGKIINNIDYTGVSKYAYWVTGCFMVTDSKKFFEVGLFDSNTFLYAEEMILAERLLTKNYYNYFLDDIEIIHNHGESVKKAYDAINACNISFSSAYYYYKNYIKCNKFQLLLARVSFKIFKTLFPIKAYIKNLMK